MRTWRAWLAAAGVGAALLVWYVSGQGPAPGSRQAAKDEVATQAATPNSVPLPQAATPAPFVANPAQGTPLAAAAVPPSVLPPVAAAPAPSASADSTAAPTPPSAKIEADKVRLMIRSYHDVMGENPVGTNAEIMQALMGRNPKQAQLGPPEGQSLNARGELVDQWGTPFFFHQLSRDVMEIRSAGPDRILGTPDDVVAR